MVCIPVFLFACVLVSQSVCLSAYLSVFICMYSCICELVYFSGLDLYMWTYSIRRTCIEWCQFFPSMLSPFLYSTLLSSPLLLLYLLFSPTLSILLFSPLLSCSYIFSSLLLSPFYSSSLLHRSCFIWGKNFFQCLVYTRLWRCKYYCHVGRT